MKMQTVTLDCHVPGTMLSIVYNSNCYCAAVLPVQSCPTLVICDACTVPNLFFHFSHVSNTLGREQAAAPFMAHAFTRFPRPLIARA